MFEQTRPTSKTRSAWALLELIYHATVREIRKDYSNALIGLILNMVQTVTLVFAFFLLFVVIGIRGSPVRGDFLLYIMSGIFIFIVHVKTVSSLITAEGPSSQMMKHAPMNTIVAILAAAFGQLYIQILSVLAVLYIYHIAFTPITIHNFAGAAGMLFLAWFTGVAVGVVFIAIKPWAPQFVTVASAVYNRVNMIASGKMFLANSLPSAQLQLFDWNPLFHIIDQARGYTFLNYNPHYTSVSYPLQVGIALIMIGLMAEFYTRKTASLSWDARR
ncbi:ABC transporter permease [Aestuariibius insulae]|uniref:ABC transporter permease n=1 Tax=Aestuariibius insulae TaxID=2058287 RepID=UPI00345E459C